MLLLPTKMSILHIKKRGPTAQGMCDWSLEGGDNIVVLQVSVFAKTIFDLLVVFCDPVEDVFTGRSRHCFDEVLESLR